MAFEWTTKKFHFLSGVELLQEGGREMCLASNHSRFKWTGGNGSKKREEREQEREEGI